MSSTKFKTKSLFPNIWMWYTQHRSVGNATLSQCHAEVSEASAGHVHSFHQAVPIAPPILGLCNCDDRSQGVVGVKTMLNPAPIWSPNGKYQATLSVKGRNVFCWDFRWLDVRHWGDRTAPYLGHCAHLRHALGGCECLDGAESWLSPHETWVEVEVVSQTEVRGHP